MLVRVANREDFEPRVCNVCLGLYLQATSVQNFITFTIILCIILIIM